MGPQSVCALILLSQPADTKLLCPNTRLAVALVAGEPNSNTRSLVVSAM
jgi:hypothetical protein